jgi:hypothetical protein
MVQVGLLVFILDNMISKREAEDQVCGVVKPNSKVHITNCRCELKYHIN